MLAFCKNCKYMTRYDLKTVKDSFIVANKELDYNKKIAICKECSSPVDIRGLDLENRQEMDKVYRQDRELISIGEIKEILERYDIGKRPLSQLLGWGDLTVTRYIDGQTPSKEYSDRLIKILEDPNYMRKILEENKDRITTTAYKKVNKRLDDLLTIRDEDILHKEKIEVVAKYILMKTQDITPLALQKLLYYSQGFYSAFTDAFLFQDDCEAWAVGPVYTDIYLKYEDYTYSSIDMWTLDEDIFSQVLDSNEMEIIDNVIVNFGRYSGKVLEKMTHYEMPWREARIGLNKKDKSNRLINKDHIREYFKKVVDNYNMLTLLDIRNYSKDMVSKISII